MLKAIILSLIVIIMGIFAIGSAFLASEEKELRKKNIL